MPMTSERRALVVVGMHRSGTSATAGVLGLLGGALPKALMPPIAGHNDVGFFEPSRIVDIHNEMLAISGSSWHDTSPLPDAWFRSPVARAFGQRLKETYVEEYGDAPLTVLKDPRVCRFLPVWREILASLNVTPLFVIPFRHPVEVAMSLARRDAFSSHKSQILWLQHVLLAEYGSRGASRAFLAYEEMMADPRRALTRLAQDLGVEWPTPTKRAFSEIEEFLDQKHHHNRAFAPDAARPEELRGLVADTYSVLEGLVGQPSAVQEQALDQIRVSYLEADQLHGPLVRRLEIDLDRSSQELAVVRSELEHCRRERDGASAEVHAQLVRTRELERQLEDSRVVIAERDGQIHRLAADRDQRLQDSEALATSHSLLIQGLNQAIADRDAQIASAGEAAAAREREHRDAVFALQQAQAARDAALRDALATTADRERALAAAQDRLALSDSEAAASAAKIAALQADVAAAVTAIAQLRASKSWRLTSPLRALKDLVTKAGR